MNLNPFLLAAALTVAAPQQSTRPGLNPTYPFRNTFVVAVESVIDLASAVDLNASREITDAQMQGFHTARNNITTMTQDEHEQAVLDDLNDLDFSLNACLLQARAHADISTCSAQFDAARRRAMTAIGKHKSGNLWQDGPPA